MDGNIDSVEFVDATGNIVEKERTNIVDSYMSNLDISLWSYNEPTEEEEAMIPNKYYLTGYSRDKATKYGNLMKLPSYYVEYFIRQSPINMIPDTHIRTICTIIY